MARVTRAALQPERQARTTAVLPVPSQWAPPALLVAKGAEPAWPSRRAGPGSGRAAEPRAVSRPVQLGWPPRRRCPAFVQGSVPRERAGPARRPAPTPARGVGTLRPAWVPEPSEQGDESACARQCVPQSTARTRGALAPRARPQRSGPRRGGPAARPQSGRAVMSHRLPVVVVRAWAAARGFRPASATPTSESIPPARARPKRATPGWVVRGSAASRTRQGE